MIPKTERFKQAIQRFDQENSHDPNREIDGGMEYPKELLYARRMTDWLEKVDPQASEALQLAARSQHICRWTIPRESYPMDRKGYLLWRTELKKFHAEKAEEILVACEYDQETIDRVKSLILKQRLKTDLESQTLEDVVCLVFLEHYFADFAAKHDRKKVIDIVSKTWAKMSENGRNIGLAIPLPEDSKNLILEAINR